MSSIFFEDGSKIVTNGFPIRIVVRDNLVVQGDAFIVSFDAVGAPTQYLKSPAIGSAGISYNYVAVREVAGREASPTTAIIDSQTAKGALFGL